MSALLPQRLAGVAIPNARKPRTHYLDGLLPERAYRPFSLWDPSLFHHLSVLKEPEEDAGACPSF